MFSKITILAITIFTSLSPLSYNSGLIPQNFQLSDIEFILSLPLDSQQDLNVTGLINLSSEHNSFGGIEIHADIPDLIKNEYLTENVLTTRHNEQFIFYEKLPHKLTSELGCDAQSICYYPDSNISIYFLTCDKKPLNLPAQSICESYQVVRY